MMYVQIIDDLLKTGYYEVTEGVYLCTRDCIIDDQKSWFNDHPFKYFDFSKHLYWLTCDEMTEPEPYDSFSAYFLKD